MRPSSWSTAWRHTQHPLKHPACPRQLDASARTNRGSRHRPEHIVGISKTTYALATPRCLEWNHDPQRTSTNRGPPHPIAGVLVLLGRPDNGDHDLWVRTGRGRLVPRDGASPWRRANHHRGSAI